MSSLKRRVGTSPAANLLFVSLLLIAGCRDTSVVTAPASTPLSPSNPTTPPSPGALTISGVMTPQYQGIRVEGDRGPVTDAVVTVNGFPIPYCCGNLYSGTLPEAVPAGGKLNLKVVSGVLTFEAPGIVSPAPTIDAPAAGSSFAATESINLSWNTPTNPDRFEVCLNCWDNSLDGEIYSTPGSARYFTIPPGALVDDGSGAVVAVYAFKSNFLEPTGTPELNSNVLFVARSRDFLISIRK